MDAEKKGFLVFGAPALERPEIDEVLAALESGWIGTGPRVARFEKQFAEYKGCRSAVALNSCTAALQLSLIAAGVGPGDEVITTPMTFCATINAIVHAGATPVLADVDPLSMNIDERAVAAAVTPRTRAILPVHVAGRPCHMRELTEVAQRNGLIIVEDCAHAIEGEIEGEKTGTFGGFGCFSFYVTKNVVTGEGGAVICRDQEAEETIRTLSLHGMDQHAYQRYGAAGYRHYDVRACGFKYNMMDLQAALGIHQLARVEQNWRRRERIWTLYGEQLADLPLQLPAPNEAGVRHAYHLYTVCVDQRRAGIDRDELLERLTARGIGVGVHYRAIPEHTYYRERFGWLPEEYPVAARIGRETLSLPLSPRLSDEDVSRVVEALRSSLRC